MKVIRIGRDESNDYLVKHHLVPRGFHTISCFGSTKTSRCWQKRSMAPDRSGSDCRIDSPAGLVRN